MATRDHFKTIANPYPERPPGSPKPQSEASSPSVLAPAYCLNRARLLFVCYRKDEAHDPEMYAAAIAAILGDYPQQVVDRVTDPRTGIASESKWLPSVAEVREFCDDTVKRMHRLAQPVHKRNSEPQPRVKTAPGQSYVEMFEKYGRPIGAFEPGGYLGPSANTENPK